MSISHFLALLVVTIFLFIGIWRHGAIWWLITLFTCFAVGFMAVTGNWEIIFLPVLSLTGLIALVVGMINLLHGDYI